MFNFVYVMNFSILKKNRALVREVPVGDMNIVVILCERHLEERTKNSKPSNLAVIEENITA